MSKPDTDYHPHAICVNGLLLGIWATKHGAEQVASLLYKNRDYKVVYATSEHHRLMKAMHSM